MRSNVETLKQQPIPNDFELNTVDKRRQIETKDNLIPASVFKRAVWVHDCKNLKRYVVFSQRFGNEVAL